MKMIIPGVNMVDKISRGTQAQWLAATSAIPRGTLCVESDTGKSKLGNGSEAYIQLDYQPFLISDLVVGLPKTIAGDAFSVPTVIWFGGTATTTVWEQIVLGGTATNA